MAYTFGSRIDDDSYALTTIDEDQGTATTKGEINGIPFESGGGGGSSDFSPAEVTVINNSGYETEIRCATYFDDEYGRFSSWSVYSDSQNDTVANVILYKGEAFISCENNTNWSFASATGDIEIDSDNPDSAYVRGNGTITLEHHNAP